MNSSAKTVVFDSSWTQSIAIVGVSAMKTLRKLFATLYLCKINAENKIFIVIINLNMYFTSIPYLLQ